MRSFASWEKLIFVDDVPKIRAAFAEAQKDRQLACRI